MVMVVFYMTEYGPAVSSGLRLAPSNLNCTPTTPTLSVALADTVTAVPHTIAPLAGAVIETVGGVGAVHRMDLWESPWWSAPRMPWRRIARWDSMRWPSATTWCGGPGDSQWRH